MEWLRDQRSEFNGGRRPKLGKDDTEKVWRLLRIYDNKTIVSEMLGVSRMTLYRFLEDHPIPETFQLEKNVEDYSEIKTWLKRQKAFAKQTVISGYLSYIRKFYRYMIKHHPERARPRLWTSDDILDFVYGEFEPYQQHNPLVALRQLGLKAPMQFPLIDLGLLPTKKTHRAKRSHARKDEYYLSIDQVKAMIENVPDGDREIETRNKAIISLLFNIACRPIGLCRLKIENLNLENHSLIIKDKGEITWNVNGLVDQTIHYIREYLNERGNPKSGYVFVKEKNGHKLTNDDINDIVKESGEKAEIQEKRLVAKSFRKSFVKYALEDCGMNPTSLIGTGKKIKTCFCVGWSDMKVLMEHYAPELMKQINEDREKFAM